jgi:hypothetical protein
MFEWDIFVSYGWSGNDPGEGDREWVAQLREQLRIALRTALGRDPRIFLDANATRAGALTPILEDALDKSRLFLFVVSPGSCRSPWCHWEILRFLDRAHSAATHNEVRLPEDRVLGVVLEPVPRDAIPELLEPLVFRPYDLTRRIEGRDETRPAVWDALNQTPSARSEFDQLVVDLNEKLKSVYAHEQQPVQPSGVTVFVGTAPAHAYERDFLIPLRRDLLLRGHNVIRCSVAPAESEDDYRVRLGAVLGDATFSVHIVGQPAKLNGWQRTPWAWQLRRASERQPKLTLFTWVDPDREADPRELAEILRKGDSHFDQRQPFGYLRTALLDRAGECVERVAADNSRSVVIAFCPQDRSFASEIKQRLQQQHGFRVQFALPPGSKAGDRNRANRNLFGSVDAVVVYYSEDDVWMVRTCLAVRQVSKEKGSPRSAALVLHPPPPNKDDCDQIGFASLPRVHTADFAAIDRWAAGVRGAGA